MSNLLYEQVVPWNETDSLSARLTRWALRVAPPTRILEEEMLSRHSSLRIGGPAKTWIEIGSRAEFLELLAVLCDEPICCVGLGSNTLFPDQGIEMPVIRLVGELASWQVLPGSDGEAIVDVMAGAINAHLVRSLLKGGWVGAEFLSLIPGTFGGAVALNAGTKEKELLKILDSVLIARPDPEERCWKSEWRTPESLAMTYRHAELAKGAIVLGGRIEVRQGNVEEAQELVQFDRDRRNRTQPYRLASVGSTFANPPGDYAGRLIEAAQLKGRAIGGARISPLHANFFVNESDATAEDFLSLMSLARHRVRTRFGVELTPEVRFVGFDGWARMLAMEEEWKDRDV
jgi:UDP-N-acetylmuramate dehydrogenase